MNPYYLLNCWLKIGEINMQTAQQEKSETPTIKTQKLTMNEKLTFGLGDFGANYSWTFIASFITIYLTDVAGIGAGIIGTIILIARITDGDRKSTRLNSSHVSISYAVLCLKQQTSKE